jgi:hypothetical protein
VPVVLFWRYFLAIFCHPIAAETLECLAFAAGRTSVVEEPVSVQWGQLLLMYTCY